MFEHRSLFDEVKAYKTKYVSFLDHPVHIVCGFNGFHLRYPYMDTTHLLPPPERRKAELV